MKTEGKVKRKFKQAKFRHLKKLLQTNFKQTSDGCKFNRKVRGDGRFIGVCSVQDEIVCDCLVPEVARQCDIFEPLRSKDEITQEFEASFERDIGEIAQDYPDLAALMWVLDLEGSKPAESELPDLSEDAFPAHVILVPSRPNPVSLLSMLGGLWAHFWGRVTNKAA